MAEVQDNATADGTAGTQSSGGTSAFSSLKQEAANLAETATTAVKNAANTGKDKAATALDDLARMAEDAAAQVDQRLGGSVGEYARRASTAVSNLSLGLKNKDVEELVDDAKAVVRQNPALAVGIAAGVGFILTRLIKLGTEAPTYADRSDLDRE